MTIIILKALLRRLIWLLRPITVIPDNLSYRDLRKLLDETIDILYSEAPDKKG